MKNSKLLWTPREAAEQLAICEKTLWSWTAPRGPIPAVRFGKAVRYSAAALSQFIAAAESGALEGSTTCKPEPVNTTQADDGEYGILPAVEFPARQGAAS